MPLEHRNTVSQRKTCEFTHMSIAFLVVLVFGSFVSAIVLGFLVAKPTLHSASFEEATCRVVQRRYFSKKTCTCSGLTSTDPYCKSSYPCLNIVVEHDPWTPGHMNFTATNTTGENAMQYRAVLHDSESELLSDNAECSYQYCSRSERLNQRKVEEFGMKFGTLNTYFPCYYNPSDTEQVILRNIYEINTAIMALAIPLAVFVISFILLTLICCILKKQSKDERRKKKVEKAELRTPQPRNYLATYDMEAFQPDEAVEARPPRRAGKKNGQAGDLGYVDNFKA